MYEPPLHDHAYAFDISPDGRLLAVTDGERAIVIWDRQTGELKRRIEKSVREFSLVLRFSPDGKYLASNEHFFHVSVRETATGQIVAKLDVQLVSRYIGWSSDGQRLTLIKTHEYGGSSLIPMSNIYPAVHEWDWRAGSRVRYLDAGPPQTND